MACRCPVCAEVHADSVHLAHHLVVLASLERGSHRPWLSDTVPGWEQLDPATLATAIDDHVDTVDDVDTDATDSPASTSTADRSSYHPQIERTDEVNRLLREAQEFTRRIDQRRDRFDDADVTDTDESTDSEKTG